ncbi:hypothetical protein WMY93_011537 [Mugilogobius chulae]|uniref:Uncharacterized protein n=1 Tax=Mugilogobius chulae TaxID=88201 RepID=A0AAW0P661_9GOBI
MAEMLGPDFNFDSCAFSGPVRDEEAESQRKAKSRHARQTRRSTQGVTLTDLKEAQKSSLDPQPGGTAAVWDDRRVSISLKESMEANGHKVTDNGNVDSRLEVIVESPGFFFSPTTRPRALLGLQHK